MKTYVLMLSKVFPAYHSKAGEPTLFAEKLGKEKLHTIRANYPLWKKRFEEIEAGRACLSIRQWSGQPYKSKQVEIKRLTAEDGIGIQKLYFALNIDYYYVKVDSTMKETEAIAQNDGLSYEDFIRWFKGCDTCKPLAIIHFTNFRY